MSFPRISSILVAAAKLEDDSLYIISQKTYITLIITILINASIINNNTIIILGLLIMENFREWEIAQAKAFTLKA